MTGTTAFIYSPEHLNYQFGRGHPLQPHRLQLTLNLIKELQILNGRAKLMEPKPATPQDLRLAHSKEYIDFVKRMSKLGRGYLDYGDTPATRGIFEAALSVVGGSITGADLIMRGEANHAFNPVGGLHHAKEDGAAGYCVFNDVAIVARHLQRRHGLSRIAIVDIDGHHGDGTQDIFYKEPILTISLHRIGIFPGTGYVSEMGEGEGLGYSVNVPLPGGTDDETYLYAFEEVVPPLIERHKPDALLTQFGVDGHHRDPLVGLSLTTRAYREIATAIHNLAHKHSHGRLLILGGGGYNPQNVARCWAVMFATVSEALPEASSKTFEDLLDGERPPKDDRVFGRVMETVARVKETIFPLHGL
ncbi:MAG: acetoin utilization protein AcuC [Candidatus Bathyarchaeia archaeon]